MESPKAALPLKRTILCRLTKLWDELGHKKCFILDNECTPIGMPRYSGREVWRTVFFKHPVEFGGEKVFKVTGLVLLQIRKRLKGVRRGGNHDSSDLIFVGYRYIEKRLCRGVSSCGSQVHGQHFEGGCCCLLHCLPSDEQL